MSHTPAQHRPAWLSLLALATSTALLLTACGGAAEGGTAKSEDSAMTTPEESLQRLEQGSALNTQDLEHARQEAVSISPDTPLRAGQTAPSAAYKSGLIAQKASTSLLPVYRFFNAGTGTHFYTSDPSERDSVIANLPSFSFEGTAFFAASSASAGLKPVYRFLNTQNGVHFYTISESERGHIEASLPQYRLEGVAYYASQVTGAGLKPLYRFFQPRTGTHFYTASDAERQHLQQTLSSTFRFEGVGYYVPDNNFSFAAPLVFAANDGIHGSELWTTDGTQAGTVLVKDINPGSANGYPSNFTRLNDVWIFTAFNSIHGVSSGELWKTDGTAEGTVLIKDINPGASGSTPTELTVFNGAVYFKAFDGIHGAELWKTDGTEAGTTMVKDSRPGNSGSNPAGLTAFNGALYFQADAGAIEGQGLELWKTDGTEAGTTIFKDINPGFNGSDPAGFASHNGTLYFHANDGSHGYELWKTDGTPDGTVLVKDINPGPGEGSRPTDHTWFNGALYFTAYDGPRGAELWTTDGSEIGTVMVKDINPGAAGSYPAEVTVFNGALYFKAFDGSHGSELWKTDGSEVGTVMVKDIVPGDVGSTPTELRVFRNSLLFLAGDLAGWELWKTDGTDAGTVKFTDIRATGCCTGYAGFTQLKEVLLFSGSNRFDGPELWRTDGTDAGTALIKDINPAGGSYPYLGWMN